MNHLKRLKRMELVLNRIMGILSEKLQNSYNSKFGSPMITVSVHLGFIYHSMLLWVYKELNYYEIYAALLISPSILANSVVPFRALKMKSFQVYFYKDCMKNIGQAFTARHFEVSPSAQESFACKHFLLLKY